jgi:hypothetical protein
VFAVAATMAVPVLGIATPAGATANSGNSANAKACQNNGWQTLYRSDGTAFKNQGDCVSYAARGNTAFQSVCSASNQAYFDVKLVAPAGVLNNWIEYNSLDGTCSIGVTGVTSYVQATSFSEADSKCLALQGTNAVSQRAVDFGYLGLPGDAWACFQNV